MQTQQVERLEAEAENLLVYLRASEDWEPGYREDPAIFEQMIRLEAKLQRDMRTYFRGLGERAPQLIDWSIYQHLKADAGVPDVVVTLTDAKWDKEGEYILVNALDDFISIETLGHTAGEKQYKIPLGKAPQNVAVIKDARENAGKLIKQQLNPTTRKLLQQSIANSISKGYNQVEATAAVQKAATNIARADLIAHTEVVNSFGRGNYVFARDAGATMKVWKTTLTPCRICSPIPGRGQIPIEQEFIAGNGKKFMHQGAHPRCRCGVVYIFPKS